MIRAVVSGIRGRMGTLVAEEIAGAEGLALVAGVERRDHPDAGASCDVDGISVPLYVDLGAIREAFDVLVDLSCPAQAAACARHVAAAGGGLVVGTTGLSDAERAEIETAAESRRVVVAPNMSLGVNLLYGLVALAARTLGTGFDIEIVEEHHRAKRDAPSGTAARLLGIAAAARGLDDGSEVHGRSGATGPRGEREIGVHAVRAGGIVGRHAVSLVSDVEEITLRHEALSRRAFARGAVAAATFAGAGPPGLYTMEDVLGLERRG